MGFSVKKNKIKCLQSLSRAFDFNGSIFRINDNNLNVFYPTSFVDGIHNSKTVKLISYKCR